MFLLNVVFGEFQYLQDSADFLVMPNFTAVLLK